MFGTAAAASGAMLCWAGSRSSLWACWLLLCLLVPTNSLPRRSTPPSSPAAWARGPALKTRLCGVKLSDYLAECASLGPVRFVVVGPGAILETVGSFSNLRFSESPSGRLATLSTDEPCFECHVRLSKVDTASQVVVEKQGKTLRVIRFIGRGEGVGPDPPKPTTHLSAILHGSDPRGVAAFDALVSKYGGSISFDGDTA